MKILVLTAGYPDNRGSLALMFAHTRNLFYKKNMDVTVLNFSTDSDYIVDEIAVISLNTYKSSSDEYDIVVCHAPNIRNHYRFLKKYDSRISKLMFFFHGHEVLRVNKSYPDPYFFKKRALFNRVCRDVYDIFKLSLWRRYFQKLSFKSHFVFVSNYLKEEFLSYTKINKKILDSKISVIYNCVGEIFQKETYNCTGEKKYDFITIRSNLDRSTYCVDIVNSLAKHHPDFQFLLIGNGVFFEYIKKADNITWINEKLTHAQAIEYMNLSSCALMPTRWDSQGVMACEMATFGMPVITSDLPVCREVFEGFRNVATVLTEDPIDLMPILSALRNELPFEKCERYFAKNTIDKEIKIYNTMVK